MSDECVSEHQALALICETLGNLHPEACNRVLRYLNDRYRPAGGEGAPKLREAAIRALRDGGQMNVHAACNRVTSIVGYEVTRPQLSPVLSRLKSEGLAVHTQGLWRLARESERATAPQG